MSARFSSLGRTVYSWPSAINLMKGSPAMFRHTVPIARRRISLPILSPNANVPMEAKTNALRPKADNGNAVAVPRCSGQLNVDVLIAAVNAVQLPVPVRKVQSMLR